MANVIAPPLLDETGLDIVDLLTLIANRVKPMQGGGSGTSDYEDLSNKPQINGHTLIGNLSSDDLDIVSEIFIFIDDVSELPSASEDTMNKFYAIVGQNSVQAYITIEDDNQNYSWKLFASGGSGGTTDYTDLSNKPSINDVQLVGNKTAANLGLQAELQWDNTPTENSTKSVNSGGIYTAISAVDAKVDNIGSVTTAQAQADFEEVFGPVEVRPDNMYTFSSSTNISSSDITYDD